ncbi:hypothetical protein GMST_35580 [Geomonas silvestris]|uniref:DUF3793 domain-containing protein n=1 Tax=Geomonas silvestris TaxID=2740184 RepID=A0A6V8MNE8_9BACT|nr:DUF3793 family protein [Geomonas silvestris]GFO61233.1 hypothetical protein GMST_35580 [Geomonas silvestris]
MARLDRNQEGGLLSRSSEAGPFQEVRPGWQVLSAQFPDDRECLASFLVLEVAEVLQGAKPANLVSIANRRRSCGRNPYLLWMEHGAALVAESGLAVRELADRGNSILLLLYRPEALDELLAKKSVAVILGKVGYPQSLNREAVLQELTRRVAGEGFPHEIGVFLGYPLKDVVGFLGWARLSFTCQGPWKIFGEPSQSLSLARLHRECRCQMSQRLAAGCSPLECLRGAVRAGLAGEMFSCAA